MYKSIQTNFIAVREDEIITPQENNVSYKIYKTPNIF